MIRRTARSVPKHKVVIIFTLTCALAILTIFYNNELGGKSQFHVFEFYFYCHSYSIAPDIVDWKSIDVNAFPAHLVMDYFSWPNRSSCKLVQYFGGTFGRRHVNASVNVGDFASRDIVPENGLDGHYAVCLDPIPVSPRPDHCTVYSFGIKNEWSFDDAFEKYGCEVFSFDPAMQNGTEDFDRSPKIHFFSLALSDVDMGKKGRTLSTIMRILRHSAIDHIKIDIEGNEWRIIPQLVGSGVLEKVKQLAIEIHLNPNENLGYYRRMVGAIKSLEDHGMIRFDSYYNHWSSAHFPALDQTGYFAYIMAWYNSNYTIKNSRL